MRTKRNFAGLCVAVIVLASLAGCPQSSTDDPPIEPGGPAPAFPGAEGHGKYVTGGRGGTVYYVTTLEDNNDPGSLRYGIGLNEPRTILFKVGGTIFLNSELRIKRNNLTIAGQSAPGDGICIAGYPLVVDADNVIIRYIRCRMGDLRNVNADGADALSGRRRKNIIIDHCSVSWSTDECSSFYGNENFTMQWCLISESLNFSLHSKEAHGYGGIWGGQKASFHHNLMAHHVSRVPRLGPDEETSTAENEIVDLRNNVYYNYNGNGAYGAEGMHVNIVNNYYKPGPAWNQNNDKRGRIMAIGRKTDNSMPALQDVWGTFYVDGNVIDGHANATADNWTYGIYNQIANITQAEKEALKLAEPLPSGDVTTHTAEHALEQVLSYAGCSLYRDSVDERIVRETWSGTTSYRGVKTNRPGIIDSQSDLKPAGAGDEWSPWPVLDPGTPVTDSDGDGIPDGWLQANHPGKSASDLNREGYTYLEVYLNGIVAVITAGQNR